MLNNLTNTVQTLSTKDNIINAIKNGWKTVLFMEAMRNLNWSRGYCWYCELDGVPNPFQRGGVLGLPCKSVSFDIAMSGNSLDIQNMNMSTHVPQFGGGIGDIQLTLLDDEQGTLRQFFERWYNQVYNPYLGTLPVTEACKQLTIHLQKSTRRNIKRVYYSIDEVAMTNKYLELGEALLGNDTITTLQTGYDWIKSAGRTTDAFRKTSDGYDFLVYPSGISQLNLQSDGSSFIELSVTLKVSHFLNQDFGNPVENSGVKTIFDSVIGDVTDGSSFLDKLADYI